MTTQRPTKLSIGKPVDLCDFEPSVACAADELDVGKSVGLDATERANETGARLGRPGPWLCRPSNMKLQPLEFAAGLDKRSAIRDVVRTPVSGFHTSFLSGGGGTQTDLLHFFGPLLVVVTILAGLAVMVLPEMDHLMQEGRKDVSVAASIEEFGVEGDFVARGLAVFDVETVANKVTVALPPILDRDQAFGQLSSKEALVEESICISQGGVGFLGWREDLLHNCAVHSNFGEHKVRHSAMKKKPTDGMFTGMLRGVPGGGPQHAAHQVFLSAEELASMKRYAFDPKNTIGKLPLGVVGATMHSREMFDGRIEYAAMGGHLIGNYDDRHRLLCVGSRGGKSRCYLVPMLVTDGVNSYFAVDVKGDLAKETALYRSKVLGQKVALLDGFKITGPACASLRTSFNPLRLIDPSSPASLVEHAAQIADAVVFESGGYRDSHWNATAKGFLEGVIMYVVTDPDIPRSRTMTEVWHQIMCHADEGGELQEKMPKSTAAGGAIGAAAEEFFGKEERERSGTLSTLRRHLHFLSYPAMQDVLQDSDLDLGDLLAKPDPMTIYSCIPATLLGPCAGFSRMLVNLMMSAFERNPKRDAHQHQTGGGHRCIAVLDEFFALGRMDSLAMAAGQIAGLGCTLFPVLQDLGQLSIYGSNAETFLGNAGTLSFFGNSDPKTLSWIEERLGTTTVQNVSKSNPSLRAAVGDGAQGASFSQNIHPLMTKAEIARFFERDDPLARQLVILPSVGPVIMQRVLIDQHEAFEGYRQWMRKYEANT